MNMVESKKEVLMMLWRKRKLEYNENAIPEEAPGYKGIGRSGHFQLSLVSESTVNCWHNPLVMSLRKYYLEDVFGPNRYLDIDLQNNTIITKLARDRLKGRDKTVVRAALVSLAEVCEDRRNRCVQYEGNAFKTGSTSAQPQTANRSSG